MYWSFDDLFFGAYSNINKSNLLMGFDLFYGFVGFDLSIYDLDHV